MKKKSALLNKINTMTQNKMAKKSYTKVSQKYGKMAKAEELS